jgi:hypothetical protein
MATQEVVSFVFCQRGSAVLRDVFVDASMEDVISAACSPQVRRTDRGCGVWPTRVARSRLLAVLRAPARISPASAVAAVLC